MLFNYSSKQLCLDEQARDEGLEDLDEDRRDYSRVLHKRFKNEFSKYKKKQNTQGGVTPKMIEGILNHYEEFRILYEEQGLDELVVGGVTFNIHDILEDLKTLPPRQREAVTLVCLYNMNELDAAFEMFGRFNTAVGLYKRIGLQKLADKYNGAHDKHVEQELEEIQKKWRLVDNTDQ